MRQLSKLVIRLDLQQGCLSQKAFAYTFQLQASDQTLVCITSEFPSSNYFVCLFAMFCFDVTPIGYSSLCAQKPLLAGSVDDIGCQELNPGLSCNWPHERKTPYHCAITLSYKYINFYYEMFNLLQGIL